MTRTVEVVVSELTAASARLQDAAQRLQDNLASVDLETQQLLSSGWKGGAATAFGSAWDQWHNGAGQVVRGLQSMSELLKIAGQEYAKTDEQTAGAVTQSFPGSGSGGSSGGSGGSGSAAASAGTSGTGAASASSAAAAQQAPSLAEQMNLNPAAQLGQMAGQATGGLASMGQMASGLGQQAGQLASGLAQPAQQLASSLTQQLGQDADKEDEESKEGDGLERRPEDKPDEAGAGSDLAPEKAPITDDRPSTDPTARRL